MERQNTNKHKYNHNYRNMPPPTPSTPAAAISKTNQMREATTSLRGGSASRGGGYSTTWAAAGIRRPTSAQASLEGKRASSAPGDPNGASKSSHVRQPAGVRQQGSRGLVGAQLSSTSSASGSAEREAKLLTAGDSSGNRPSSASAQITAQMLNAEMDSVKGMLAALHAESLQAEEATNTAALAILTSERERSVILTSSSPDPHHPHLILTSSCHRESASRSRQELEKMLASAQPTHTSEMTTHATSRSGGTVRKRKKQSRAEQISRNGGAGVVVVDLTDALPDVVVEDEVLVVNSADYDKNDDKEVSLVHTKPRLSRSPVSAPGAIEPASAPAPLSPHRSR